MWWNLRHFLYPSTLGLCHGIFAAPPPEAQHSDERSDNQTQMCHFKCPYLYHTAYNLLIYHHKLLKISWRNGHIMGIQYHPSVLDLAFNNDFWCFVGHSKIHIPASTPNPIHFIFWWTHTFQFGFRTTTTTLLAPPRLNYYRSQWPD